jgi:excisionase family DNA binding protein
MRLALYPVSLSINNAARVIGIGRTKLYELINRGDLKTIRIGRRTLVLASSIHAMLEKGAA